MRVPSLYRCLGLGLCVLAAACGNDPPGPEKLPDAGRSASDGGLFASDGAVVLPKDCDPIETTYEGFAKGFFETHCLACHSVDKQGDARLGAPPEMSFDTADDIAFHQARIMTRAVVERAMPPGAPLSECEAAQLATYLVSLGGAGQCTPACAGKDCGPDGCGGVCGACEAGQMCGSAGLCVSEGCKPQCIGVACGDDQCGGVCGSCGTGLACDGAQQCVCAPDCTGKACGDDGCGGSCGDCGAGEVCTAAGSCLCLPECSGKDCGPDGCGGSCGTCKQGDSCMGNACVTCTPDCTGKACGASDGCGGTCTACTAVGGKPRVCNTTLKQCVLATACMPKSCSGYCGDDGCGGTCGCSGGLACIANQCACEPDCVGKTCGSDGCSGSCGTCADGLQCNGSGDCGCTADCSGRECGSDGCGGTCGSCDSGLFCSASGQCAAQCAPSCAGKQCGDDGCGGSCGSCGSAQSCSAGQCVAAAISFDTVYGIFTKAGCTGAGCHGSAKPAAGLDLSTKSSALSDLVDVDSQQCSGKKRVASGDSSQSYLVNKLTGVGMCTGSQMPKGKPALSAADIATIRAWIDGL